MARPKSLAEIRALAFEINQVIKIICGTLVVLVTVIFSMVQIFRGTDTNVNFAFVGMGIGVFLSMPKNTVDMEKVQKRIDKERAERRQKRLLKLGLTDEVTRSPITETLDEVKVEKHGNDVKRDNKKSLPRTKSPPPPDYAEHHKHDSPETVVDIPVNVSDVKFPRITVDRRGSQSYHDMLDRLETGEVE